MTFPEQQEFLQSCVAQFPHQRHFNVDDAYAAFALIPEPSTVVEMGGWDGTLAWNMLESYRIKQWINYDIVEVPQLFTDHRYSPVLLDDYIWNQWIDGDVFVATHAIEHLSGHHLTRLLAVVRTEWIYFEAPLLSEGETWEGYGGTHVLELTWPEVKALVGAFKYEIVRTTDRTCLWREM